MADNVIIPASGTGDATPTIAADDVGGAKYQRVKISVGADGVVGDATPANPLPVDDADSQVLYGALTEAAPASDTASSGLNGRLQRIAQRITSLIALLPASLGQKTMANGLAVTIASDQSSIPVTTTPPANASENVAQINGVTPLMGAGATGTGSHRVTPSTANTGTAATSFSSTTSAVALSSNAAARLRTIYNNSDQDCHVNLGAVAVSVTSYHVKVPKLGGFFSTNDYSGEIRGIMAGAITSGQVNFGEMT